MGFLPREETAASTLWRSYRSQPPPAAAEAPGEPDNARCMPVLPKLVLEWPRDSRELEPAEPAEPREDWRPPPSEVFIIR